MDLIYLLFYEIHMANERLTEELRIQMEDSYAIYDDNDSQKAVRERVRERKKQMLPVRCKGDHDA